MSRKGKASPGGGWQIQQQGPDDHETRGKTAQQRLRRLDQFLLAFEPGRLRKGGLVVDLGYGRTPITTVEWFERLQHTHPNVRMLGVERDGERVALAQQWTKPHLSFRKGDFQLPLHAGERVQLMRAMNVLRQYDESASLSAHNQLVAQMEEGALLAEGTCDPSGRTMVVQILRRIDGRPHSEGVLFARSFHGDFDPRSFQPVLPKHLIHRVTMGEPIAAFFDAWADAAARSRSVADFGQRQFFVATAEALSGMVSGVDVRRSWLRNGWVFWRHAPYP